MMNPVSVSRKTSAANAPIVEVRPDRAQHLFPVLPGTSLVDPHRLFSGGARCGGAAVSLPTVAAAAATSATASRPATRALLTISAVFARTDRPSVIVAMRASSHGVRSGPWIPAASASTVACSTAARASASGSAIVGGHGHAHEDARAEAEVEVRRDQALRPRPRPAPSGAPGCPRCARRSRAGPPARSRRPARRASRAPRGCWGRRGSPSGPAQTTAIGVRASSSRSDEMSSDGPAPGGGAMDAADAAGGEDADARPRARRSSWPRRSSPPSRRARAPTPRLGRAAFITEPRSAVASASRSPLVQAHEQAAVADRHRGGNGAGFAHGRLGGARDREVVRVARGRG